MASPEALAGDLHRPRDADACPRDAADLYCRTDTHWSFEGCYLAYAEICRALGTEPRVDLRDRPSYEADHDGDLGSAFDPPRRARSRTVLMQQDAVRTYGSPIVEARERAGLLHTLHVGAHVVYGNAKATDPRRLALFGDSFSHVMPYMLTIMLAETFREVHFVWSTSLDWSYVERVRPDIVLTEVAERFMVQLPDDTFSVDGYAQERFGAELAAQARERPVLRVHRNGRSAARQSGFARQDPGTRASKPARRRSVRASRPPALPRDHEGMWPTHSGTAAAPESERLARAAACQACSLAISASDSAKLT